MTSAKFLQTMKRWFFITTLLVIISTLPSCAQTERPAQGKLTWYTSLAEAQKVSNSTKKPIFAFFTGSDWCGWCMRLQKEVFYLPEFAKWAKENVILVELDFPRRKALSPELQKQNAELQQMFNVEGYPTVWFVTPTMKDGKVSLGQLGKTGYVAGGPQVWIDGAKAILKNKK